MGRQATMSDIARRAGVSRVAVSYAINGRPGVSDAVRERILRIAAELGFLPSVPAQALHGAAAHAIGLAVSRPSPGLSVETFHRRLISGIQAELAGRGFGLVLQFVTGHDDELDVYRRWHGERRVDGVIVSDLTLDDPRPRALASMGLPAVILGEPSGPGGLTHLWSDPAAGADLVAGHLAALGHRRVARVCGPAGLLPAARRAGLFAAACERAGMACTLIPTDRTGEAGAQVTRRVLSSTPRPTAIVYDNDVMAVAGLSVAGEMGLAVPGELSLVAGDDFPLCQAVRPALTVLSRDVDALGGQAVRLLFELLDGGEPRHVPAPAAQLVTRGSTGSAPR
ncbi:LacI family DNA-binding transcriptional regulator [Nonomuraea sp. B5E05]|uniref:LacI family DNA-binding transcriptional regulator n=1 Tax=Nonomuraea sp. B5E05 TaxID=3153569 RepID=UPI0032615A48